jgi:hypothetical protein
MSVDSDFLAQKQKLQAAAINDASKFIAQAIYELNIFSGYAWKDDEPASKEINPIILMLESALEKLLNEI